MKKLLLILMFLASTMAVASYIDHTGLIKEELPTQFESTVQLSSLYPNSLISYVKGHTLQWETTKTSDYIVSNGSLAIIEDGIIYVTNDTCNGLVAPEGTEMLTYSGGDVLIASTRADHYIFYLPECVQYSQMPRIGNIVSMSDGMICEADFSSRVVKDLVTGFIIYQDEPKSSTVAIVGDESSCYFLQRDGDVEAISQVHLDYYSTNRWDNSFAPKIELLTTLAEAVASGSSYYSNERSGFSGFTFTSSFNINFSKWGSVYLEFDAIPEKGFCLPSTNSQEAYCSSMFADSFHSVILNSEKFTITDENIFVHNDSALKVYNRQTSWVKSFMPSYKEPIGCVYDDEFYFSDPVGDIWRVESLFGAPQKVKKLPDECDRGLVVYRDGVFFSDSGHFLYRYADIVRIEGDRLLFSHASPDKYYYFVVDE